MLLCRTIIGDVRHAIPIGYYIDPALVLHTLKIRPGRLASAVRGQDYVEMA